VAHRGRTGSTTGATGSSTPAHTSGPWDRRPRTLQPQRQFAGRDTQYVQFADGSSLCFDPRCRSDSTHGLVNRSGACAGAGFRRCWHGAAQHLDRTMTDMLVDRGGVGRFPPGVACRVHRPDLRRPAVQRESAGLSGPMACTAAIVSLNRVSLAGVLGPAAGSRRRTDRRTTARSQRAVSSHVPCGTSVSITLVGHVLVQRVPLLRARDLLQSLAEIFPAVERERAPVRGACCTGTRAAGGGAPGLRATSSGVGPVTYWLPLNDLEGHVRFGPACSRPAFTAGQADLRADSADCCSWDGSRCHRRASRRG